MTSRSARLPRAWARLWLRGRGGVIGGVTLALVTLLAVLAPLLAPHDPSGQDLGQALRPGFWAAQGSWAFPLGTDTHGRDLLSRLLFGSRISLLVGLAITVFSSAAGTLLGLVAAHYRRSVDLVISGLTDVLLAFPPILLAVVVVALLGPGLDRAMIAVAIVFIPRTTRIVRSAALLVRSQEFVEASLSLGARSSRVIWRHLLPNVFPPIFVQSSFTMAAAITITAGLGFLGLGAQPPTPEWGAMLSEGRNYILLGIWWYATFPGLAIMMVVLGLNLLGDSLQGWLDPRLRRVA